MHAEQVQVTLSRAKIREIVHAYNVISDFLDTVLPREMLYKRSFLKGLDQALEEVKSGKTQKVQSYDDFIE